MTAMVWIDADVQLPKEYQRVLLYTPYRVFGDDFACVGNLESLAACSTVVENEVVPLFTHWMALPDIPQPLS